jgi:putative toxin-antitoxin system antitoxin component (TIGR02293 family)
MDEIDAKGLNTFEAPTFWLIANQLNARTEAQRLQYIQAGFPPGWVRATREAFKLSPRRLEQLLNVSMSTLERRQRDSQPLDVVASERLDRVANIAIQAAVALGDRAVASRWMVSSHAALGEQTPIRLCETEIGVRQVRRLLKTMAEASVRYQPPPCPEPCHPANAQPLQSPRSGQSHD